MILELYETYDVEVIQLLNQGVVVSLSDGSTQFVHISKLSDDFVETLEGYISVGDKKTAVCVRNKKSNGSKELSFKESDIKYASTSRKQHVSNSEKNLKIPEVPSELKSSQDYYSYSKQNNRKSNRKNYKAQNNYKEWY